MGKYGLIGGKLGHSYSMGIHDRYFKMKNCISTYELIETPPEKLSETLEQLKGEGFDGLNVTIPHKVSVMEFADEISPEALSMGAVNTLKFCNGKVFAYNTDYYGMKKTFEKFGVNVKGKDVYVLGTGGAAGAISSLCRAEGGNVTFVSRTPSEKAIGYEKLSSVPCGGVLINCTPVGMYPDVLRTPTESIDGFEWVVDLIYNPCKTLLLKNAEAKGIKTVNGLYMLVAQAVYSESIWHDTELDEEITDRIYNELLKEYEGNE